MLLFCFLSSCFCRLLTQLTEIYIVSRAKSASFLLSNQETFAKHLHDFNILAVRSAGGEVHVLDELGMDELGMGAYALAPEFNGRAWHCLT